MSMKSLQPPISRSSAREAEIFSRRQAKIKENDRLSQRELCLSEAKNSSNFGSRKASIQFDIEKEKEVYMADLKAHHMDETYIKQCIETLEYEMLQRESSYYKNIIKQSFGHFLLRNCELVKYTFFDKDQVFLNEMALKFQKLDLAEYEVCPDGIQEQSECESPSSYSDYPQTYEIPLNQTADMLMVLQGHAKLVKVPKIQTEYSSEQSDCHSDHKHQKAVEEMDEEQKEEKPVEQKNMNQKLIRKATVIFPISKTFTKLNLIEPKPKPKVKTEQQKQKYELKKLKNYLHRTHFLGCHTSLSNPTLQSKIAYQHIYNQKNLANAKQELRKDFLVKIHENLSKFEIDQFQDQPHIKPGFFINQACILNKKHCHLEDYKLIISGKKPVIAAINNEDFIDVLDKLHQIHIEKYIHFLKEIPGFQYMSKTGVRKLLGNFKCEKVDKGWSYDKNLKKLYLIIDGQFSFVDQSQEIQVKKLESEKKTLTKVLKKESQSTLAINIRKSVQKQTEIKKMIQNRSTQKVKKIILEKGHFFGEDLLLRAPDQNYHIQCTHMNSILLSAKIDDIQKQLRNEPEIMAHLQTQLIMKYPDSKPLEQHFKKVVAAAARQQHLMMSHCDHSPESDRQNRYKSVLVNHREMDFRQTLQEVIEDYPSVKNQRSICQESYRSMSSGRSYSQGSPKNKVVYMNSKIEKAIDGIIIGEVQPSLDLKRYRPNVRKKVVKVINKPILKMPQSSQPVIQKKESIQSSFKSFNFPTPLPVIEKSKSISKSINSIRAPNANISGEFNLNDTINIKPKEDEMLQKHYSSSASKKERDKNKKIILGCLSQHIHLQYKRHHHHHHKQKKANEKYDGKSKQAVLDLIHKKNQEKVRGRLFSACHYLKQSNIKTQESVNFQKIHTNPSATRAITSIFDQRPNTAARTTILSRQGSISYGNPDAAKSHKSIQIASTLRKQQSIYY